MALRRIGSIIYTPDAGFAGTDEVVYRVCSPNDQALCDDATLTITVAGDAPPTDADQAFATPLGPVRTGLAGLAGVLALLLVAGVRYHGVHPAPAPLERLRRRPARTTAPSAATTAGSASTARPARFPLRLLRRASTWNMRLARVAGMPRWPDDARDGIAGCRCQRALVGVTKARHEPPRSIALPPLSRYAASALEPGGDHEAVAFADLDLTEQRAEGATFLSCRIERCRLDGLDLRRARITDTLVIDTEAVGLDAGDSVWRESLVDGGRFGALGLSGSALTDVRIRGAKLDFVDLSHARLHRVAFEDCMIGELELAEAQARSVTFTGGSIRVLNANAARFEDVDLSATGLRTIGGVASLHGAIISASQLIDLAPLLAASAGIRIRDD